MSKYEYGEVKRYAEYIYANPLDEVCSFDRFMVGLNGVAEGFGRTGESVLMWLLESDEHASSEEVIALKSHILVEGSPESREEILSNIRSGNVGYVGGKISLSVNKSSDQESFSDWFKSALHIGK